MLWWPAVFPAAAHANAPTEPSSRPEAWLKGGMAIPPGPTKLIYYFNRCLHILVRVRVSKGRLTHLLVRLNPCCYILVLYCQGQLPTCFLIGALPPSKKSPIMSYQRLMSHESQAPAKNEYEGVAAAGLHAPTSQTVNHLPKPPLSRQVLCVNDSQQMRKARIKSSWENPPLLNYLLG